MRRIIVFFLLVNAGCFSQWVQTDDIGIVMGTGGLSIVDVGVDLQGNAIVVYDDARKQIKGARLGVDSLSWQATSNLSEVVQITGLPVLSVAPDGDAVAIWREPGDNNRVLVKGSRLPSDTLTWVSTTVLDSDVGGLVNVRNSQEVAMGMDCKGNAIAVWSNFEQSAEPFISGAKLKAKTLEWKETEKVSTQGYEPSETVPPIRIAVSAGAVAVVEWKGFGVSDTFLFSAKIFPKSNTWNPLSESMIDFFTRSHDLALDRDGNAVRVYSQALQDLSSDRLELNSFDWEPTNPILEGEDSGSVKVKQSCEGYTVSIFSEENLSNYSLRGMTLPIGSDTWSASTLVTPENDLKVSNVSFLNYLYALAMDSAGNAVAVWHSASTDKVSAAILPVGETEWVQTNSLSAPFDRLNSIDVAITEDGSTAVAAWKTGDGEVQAAKAVYLFPPFPPASIKGEQVVNTFALQKEVFNRIFWAPSPSNDVFYELYRNGVLIKTYPNDAKLFYIDRGQKKGEQVTYEVFAVFITNGKKSIPVSITL